MPPLPIKADDSRRDVHLRFVVGLGSGVDGPGVVGSEVVGSGVVGQTGVGHDDEVGGQVGKV